jgi:hypothetical protein
VNTEKISLHIHADVPTIRTEMYLLMFVLQKLKSMVKAGRKLEALEAKEAARMDAFRVAVSIPTYVTSSLFFPFLVFSSAPFDMSTHHTSFLFCSFLVFLRLPLNFYNLSLRSVFLRLSQRNPPSAGPYATQECFSCTIAATAKSRLMLCTLSAHAWKTASVHVLWSIPFILSIDDGQYLLGQAFSVDRFDGQ